MILRYIIGFQLATMPYVPPAAFKIRKVDQQKRVAEFPRCLVFKLEFRLRGLGRIINLRGE